MNKQKPKAKINHKLAIYQIFTRLFGNQNLTNQFNGSIETNGCGKFKDINTAALKSIKSLGITHVWYTGVIEHATMTDYTAFGIAKDHPSVVKGKAGSPYAIKDYYDIDPDLAVNVDERMQEFEELVKRTHQQELKVIIDFIPNHLARAYKSDKKPDGVRDFGEDDDNSVFFDPKNNFYYLPGNELVLPKDPNDLGVGVSEYTEKPAKATGNDVFSHHPTINDWFETIKLNYGVNYRDGHMLHFDPIPDTWIKMKDILLFWSAKGVDAFRCDMAEMVPVEFWEWVIKEVKTQYPEVIFIAEIYNPHNYRTYIFRGGFDYLYDKVGLYDCMRALIEGHGSADRITEVWQFESGDYAEHMLRFLENHDEQRLASDFFGKDPFIGLPAMALSSFLHSGPLMLYFGQELGIKAVEAEGFQGADGRTTIFDYWGLADIAAWNNNGKWNTSKLSKDQKSLRKAYTDIINFAKENEAITDGQFFDLQYVNGYGQSVNYNSQKLYSFLRFSKKQKLLFVFNFDHTDSYETSVKIPSLAYDMMGIANKKKWSFNNLGSKAKKIHLTENEALPIKLPPNSWQVYEIA